MGAPRGGRFSAGGTAPVRATLEEAEGAGLGEGEADREDAAHGESSGVLKPEEDEVFGNAPGSGVGGNRLEADDLGKTPEAADLGNTEEVEDLGNHEVEVCRGKAEEGLGDGKLDEVADGSGMSDWRYRWRGTSSAAVRDEKCWRMSAEASRSVVHIGEQGVGINIGTTHWLALCPSRQPEAVGVQPDLLRYIDYASSSSPAQDLQEHSGLTCCYKGSVTKDMTSNMHTY